MGKISKKTMIESLERFKIICDLMNNNIDGKVIDEIISFLSEERKEKSTVQKKEPGKNNNLEKVLEILEALSLGKSEVLIKNKMQFVKVGLDIGGAWDSISEAKRKKITILELNVIYDILYKPETIRYISKAKSKIIDDIYYFINNEKRDKALAESNLI